MVRTVRTVTAADANALPAGSVHVCSMLDGDDRDLLVNAVDDAEVAASGAIQTFQREAKRLTNAVWILCRVAELDDRDGHLLRQPR